MTPTLPVPTPEAQAASARLTERIHEKIRQSGGFLSFCDFMQTALYEPQYGYYTGGAHKIGTDGDFITAPTLTPLFAQTLAVQLRELLPHTAADIYEFGAGTGALAADLLNILSGSLNRYYIIELSPELAERQRRHIARHASEHLTRVEWLHSLPDNLNGIIIGNEVLDAMPCERIRYRNGIWEQTGLSTDTAGKLIPAVRPAPPEIAAEAALRLPETEHYTSELHLQQQAFIRTLATKLRCGAILLIDYGFDQSQYYHPQRSDGTLIGHYRHHTIHDPLTHIGLCDLTCHINFTALAEAACEEGLDLVGYTSQAAFLLNLGLTDLLAQTGSEDSTAYIHTAAACQILLNPHEMGELFKVIAFSRNISLEWTAFSRGDLCHRL